MNNQAQVALQQVQNLLTKLDDRIEKVDQKIANYQLRVKLYVQQGNKKRAMRKMAEIKEYQKQLITMENQRLVFTQVEIQLEMADENMDLASVFKNTNDYLKSQQHVKDELEEQLLDFQEYLQKQEETDQLWKDMAEQGVDKQELEDEFAKYEAQVMQEEMEKVPNIRTNNQMIIEQENKEKQQQQQALQQNYKPIEKTNYEMEKAINDLLI